MSISLSACCSLMKLPSTMMVFSITIIINHYNYYHAWHMNHPHLIHRHGYKHRYSVNAWAGIICNQIIGLYIQPERLNGNVYRMFLEEALPDLLDDIPLCIRRTMWFQHDGTPAHFVVDVRLSIS